MLLPNAGPAPRTAAAKTITLTLFGYRILFPCLEVTEKTASP